MLEREQELDHNPPPLMTTQPLTPLPLTEPDPLVGQRLGDFVVEQAIAAGGMGVVYRARHPLIGRLAAIKVLKPEFAADRDQTDRFLREAQSLAAIKHRGIIEIIGFGNTSDGRQYMATEFLEGESLEQLIAREAPMPPMRVLGLLDEVLNALSAAHKSQVVHRDLKPSNVFIATQSTGERIVKLLDFGLAKQSPVTLADVQDGVLAKASLVAGTPEYIAPEQARGFAATPRTDLYCIGVMMFEMLSGTLPFKADTIVEMLKKHVYEPAPRLSGRVSNLPDPLIDLVMQLLEKEPEKRPGSAELVRQTVQRITRQLQQEATVQRANPLRVVPAPFRMAEPEAPTPPLDKRMIVTEPVIRPVTEPKLEEQKGRKLWPLALLVLLLIPFGWWALGSATTKPVETVEPPTPKEPVAVQAARVEPPAPAPVAQVEVQTGTPVMENPAEEDPLSALPKPKPVKKETQVAPPLKAAVAVAPPPMVAARTCIPDGEWKGRGHARLEQLQSEMVAKQGAGELDRLQGELKEWSRKIDEMPPEGDCADFELRLRAWVKKQSQ
jgi:serine/threonine-protein kinase